MRRIAQPVNNPEIEIFQRRPAFGGDIAEIGGIGGIANAVAERGDVAVLQVEGGERDRPALAEDLLALACFDRMPGQDRRIFAAFRRDEAIGEPRHAIGQRRLADALRAADQPGVRDSPAAIGGKQRRLRLAMPE